MQNQDLPDTLFTQSPPCLGNQFDDDPLLGSWIRRTLAAPIVAELCGELRELGALAGGELYRLRAENIVAPAAVLAQSRHLALLDVVNAAAWILVVLLLEAEVRLQVRSTLGGVLLRLGAALQSLVYAVLLCAALYWGFVGDFLDFWDAFLWLLAFVFIELNIFQWQKETAQLARAQQLR